jgi:glutaminase
MQESEHAFPHNTDIEKAIDFYFQMCSCDVTCDVLATIAATFANHGTNPITNKYVLQPNYTSRHTNQISGNA